MNALMITLAFRMGSWKIVPLRIIAGALAGAAIAQAAAGLPRWQGMLLWLPAAMMMMHIAQSRTACRSMLAGAVLLMCAAGLVGGIVLALWGAMGSLAAAYLLGGFVSAVIGICAGRTRRAAQEAQYVRLICTCCGRSAAFDAMIDSGNTLRDYLTHLPVIVLPERTGRGKLNLSDLPLRPIFAQTAGGRQKMYVLAPETITLEIDGEHHVVQAVFALSPQMSESIPALVPASLLGGLRNSNRGG